MATTMYLIKALSNLHVGSGEVNYGLIDNLIQRDPITTLPNINSSSLKGALREFFSADSKLVYEVFGSNPDEKDPKKRKQGAARFFEANLLSIPVRSDKRPYLMATSIDVIKKLIDDIKSFSCEGSIVINSLEKFMNCFATSEAIVFDSDLQGACIEDVDLKAMYVNPQYDNIVTKIFGENLVVLNSEKFKMLCDDNHLPVIARNNLENGTSANLWYEQVLPRYSRLYFMLKDGEKLEEKMTKDLVQIGANATIGYGFCEITNVLNSQK